MAFYNDPRRQPDEIPTSLGLAVLLIGAALGAVAGLLLAPKSGKDLRADLTSRAGDWKAHAEDLIAQGREKVISGVESSRNGS